MKTRLFIKSYCGWCHEVMDWLNEHGIAYEELDVISSSVAMSEMVSLSGQTRAPVIEVEGEILADFDADELAIWWKEQEFGFPKP